MILFNAYSSLVNKVPFHASSIQLAMDSGKAACKWGFY